MQTAALDTQRDAETRNTAPASAGRPRGQVAGRELQPAASAWRHKRGPYHPSLAQEKVEIQSLKHSFC